MKNSDRKARRLHSAAAGSVAVTILLGIQTLRSFLPQMSFLLRDRLGWSAWEIGRAGFVLFGLGFTVAIMARVLGFRGKLLLFSMLLPACRLASQLWHGDPIGDLLLSTLGLAAFFLALAAQVAVLRAISGGGGCLAVGWILGLLADVAFFGLAGTWDLIWREGTAALAIQAGVVAFAVAILLRFFSYWQRAGSPSGDLSTLAAWGWIGMGPYLFLLHAQVANPGRYAALLNQSSALAWMLIAAAQVTALVVVTAWLRRGGSPGVLLMIPATAGLVAILWQPWPRGALASAQVFLGGLLATLLFAVVLMSVEAGAPTPGLRRLAWAHGGAVLLLGLFIFAHSSAFDLRFPITGDRLFAFAALLLGLCAFGACGLLHEYPPPERRGWRSWQAVGLMLALPALVVSWQPPIYEDVEAESPLRIVSFNLHCGINPRGDFDLEALARILEAEQSDVIALQEVSRGWMVNGSSDMVEWLARRLGMRYAFAGTGDALWGNAVLSRLPILSWRQLPLPSEGLLLRRGVLDVTLGLGGGDSLRVLATHLHHPDHGSAMRQSQALALLDYWRDSPRTVLLGDLNAEPGAPEIELLRNAGLVDSFAVAGAGDGYTFSSFSPSKRIDYIWLSPDLDIRRFWVPASEASDHLPVVAEVALERDRAGLWLQ